MRPSSKRAHRRLHILSIDYHLYIKAYPPELRESSRAASGRSVPRNSSSSFCNSSSRMPKVQSGVKRLGCAIGTLGKCLTDNGDGTPPTSVTVDGRKSRPDAASDAGPRRGIC